MSRRGPLDSRLRSQGILVKGGEDCRTIFWAMQLLPWSAQPNLNGGGCFVAVQAASHQGVGSRSPTQR